MGISYTTLLKPSSYAVFAFTRISYLKNPNVKIVSVRPKIDNAHPI